MRADRSCRISISAGELKQIATDLRKAGAQSTFVDNIGETGHNDEMQSAGGSGVAARRGRSDPFVFRGDVLVGVVRE
jgi:hypothetical protein